MPISEAVKSRLDPVYAAWLEASNPPLPEGFQATIEQMREAFIQQAAPSNGPIDEQLDVIDDQVLSRDKVAIPVRIYKQKAPTDINACCVYVHGGGWVLGDLNTHEGICNDIAVRTGMHVIAIDYRLSPEHHYPAALHDTIDVLLDLQVRSAHYGIDPREISMAADSAGTSLAVAASLSLVENPALPKKLALIYPALGADMDRPSFTENKDIPGLSSELMKFFFVSYLGGETLPDPLAAPLTVNDISGLPPTFISAAELDPLRDDATDFAARLRAAKVPVELRIETGVGHGYLWVRRQSAVAADAFTSMVNFLSQDRH